jgi:hypothetical protein
VVSETLAEMQAAMRRIEVTLRRRIVLCAPDTEARLQAAVDAYSLGGLVTVRASEHVPEGTAYVINCPEGDQDEDDATAAGGFLKIVGIGDPEEG